MSRHINIYESNQRQKVGIFRCWFLMIKNITLSGDLIAQLFKRDFIAVYKKSFFGVAWIFIIPVISIVSWVFMNMAGILKPGDVGIPYPAYVMLSMSIWRLFVGFYTAATETLGAGASFIMQVKYPHEVLLIKQTAQELANFTLGFVPIVAMLFVFGVSPNWKIVFLPIMVIPLFFLGAGIGLVISVISVVSLDIKEGFKFLLGLLLFITPVIYGPKVESELLAKILEWNPLTYLIGTVRDIIIYGKAAYIDRYVISSLFAFFIFLFSWRLFFLSEEKVIEKMI